MRDCLGYARTATETGYTIAAQLFQAGLMLSEPGGRFIYVVFDTYLGGSSCISRPDLCVPDYERYPNPTR